MESFYILELLISVDFKVYMQSKASYILHPISIDGYLIK